jgi:D-lactate dehydrogenase
VIIYIVDAEPAEERFFMANLADQDVRCVRGTEEVNEDAEIVSVFIGHKVDAAFVSAHPHLRLVATRSSSLEHIDVAACRDRGIAVSHVPNYGENTVAEHTFALILALARRLREVIALKTQGRFSYEATRGIELSGKTLGIIGMGHIGQRVVVLANAFEMRVVAHDVEAPPDLAQTLGFEFVSLDELLGRSDIVSLHTNLSSSTYHILNQKTLAQCRPGVLIINTARGALIETQALREALDSGQVGGAGLDVLQDERVLRDTPAHIIGADIVKHLRSDSRAHEERDADRVRELQELMLGDALLERRNVIFTPHVAFNTVEAIERICWSTLEKIQEVIGKEGRKEDK